MLNESDEKEFIDEDFNEDEIGYDRFADYEREFKEFRDNFYYL